MSRPTTHPTPRLVRAPELGLEEALAAHATAHVERFGPGEVRTFFSPGRVNLFGGHLDYNGGPVMPTAIDRGTFVALRRRDDGVVRMVSVFDDEAFEGALDALPDAPCGRWFDYPLGVVRALRSIPETLLDSGFEITFGGNLPVGAGLSSSASITVGTAFALDHVFGLRLEPVERVAA
ncbi:MAG: galactokinase family protein, partial [Planctomycetota bacterium]